MKAEEVIDMFRHYRHDLLNDLQLIHGYASMGNIKMIQEKLKAIFDKTAEERKLTNLKCPHFTLWIMNFNSSYDNFRLNYQVNIESVDFSSYDLSLLATCEEILQIIHNHTSKEKLYNGELEIFEENGAKIRIMIKGPISYKDELQKKLAGKLFIEVINVKDMDCELLLSISSDSYPTWF